VRDFFIHGGSNGAHQCLIFDLLGPSLRKIIGSYGYEDGETLEPDVLLRISEQLLEALACLNDVNQGFQHPTFLAQFLPRL
jgi:hypothetical protein